MPSSACTLSTTGTLGPDRITRLSYDDADRVLTEERAVGTSLAQTYATYAYTPNGQRQTVKDANANLTTYEYDRYDRLSRLRFPVPTLSQNASSTTDDELYGYDLNGNLTSLTKRGGQVITSCYDNLNRPTKKLLSTANCGVTSGGAADVFTTYDLLGEVLSARFVSASGSGVISVWDKAGRRTAETSYGKAIGSQYDAAGNRTRVTYPDGLYVQYGYDALNRMTTLSENGSTTLGTYGYDNLARKSGLSRGNCVFHRCRPGNPAEGGH